MVGATASSVLFGTREQVGVGRGLAEFRAGRPVVITGSGETLLCLPVEGLDIDRLAAFRAICAPSAAATGVDRAARALARPRRQTNRLRSSSTPDVDVSTIMALVADAKADHDVRCPSRQARPQALPSTLVKLAQVLPAVLVADTTPEKVAALQSAHHHRRGQGGGALPRRCHAVARHRRRGRCAAQLRRPHPLRGVPRRVRRRSGRGDRRHARICRSRCRCASIPPA